MVNIDSVGDNVDGTDILRGLRAECASSPGLSLDSESCGIMARSDNGRGARMSSPVMALCILFLSTVLGVPGVTQNCSLVGVGTDRVVVGLSGLPGIVSSRAPAVLGGCNEILVFKSLGNDFGGIYPSLGGGSGGAGGFLIIHIEA